MTNQSSIADTFAAGATPDGAVIDAASDAAGSAAGGAPGSAAGGAAVFVAGGAAGEAAGGASDPTDAAARADALQQAAAAVARLGSSSADYDALSDADALAGQKTIAQAQHELDTRKAWMAKTLAHRSRWELGQAGLAKKQGFLSPEDLIQNLTGTTRAESRKLVGVGQMLGEAEEADARAAAAETEAARRLLDDALGPDAGVGAGCAGDTGDAGGAADTGGTSGSGDPTATLPAPEPVPLPWHAPISHAVSTGDLSIDAAHALRSGLGDIDAVVTGPVLADALAGLLDEAPRLNADQLLKRARQTRDSLDADGIRQREHKAWDDRYLHIWTLGTGQVRVDGLFPPEQGEFIKATFDSLTSPRRGGVRFVDTTRATWARRVQNDPRSTTQITCDGFIDLLKAGTTINPHDMLGGRRPAVQIITTATPTARPTGSTRALSTPTASTSAGPSAAPGTGAEDILICEPGQGGHGYLEGNSAPVSAETIERLICDSGSVDISFDGLGRPLDVGRDERLFNRAQRRALAARDGGCRWPGCDRPPAFTEAHHINHWLRDRGATDVDQGILLCPAHHLLLHNQRWQIFENAGRYWLRPPLTVDPGQVLIDMPCRNRLRRT